MTSINPKTLTPAEYELYQELIKAKEANEALQEEIYTLKARILEIEESTHGVP